jgi:hypothetical protein
MTTASAMMTPLVAEARRQANDALTPGEQALPEPGWDFRVPPAC